MKDDDKYSIDIVKINDDIYVRMTRAGNHKLFTIDEFRTQLTEWIWKSQKYDAVVNYIDALSNRSKGDK